MALAAILGSFGGGFLLGQVAQLFRNPALLGANRFFPILPPSVQEGLVLFRRGDIDRETFLGIAKDNGIGERGADLIMQANRFFPSPQDLVTWQAREVFEPDAVEKFGLDAEFEGLDLSSFAKAGVDTEQARNFWRAHWQHPPFNQIAEMFFRDVLGSLEDRNAVPGSEQWQQNRERAEQLFFEWFRLVEVPPFWRDRLREITFAPLTRVDARRMWDMRVLNEDELRRAYLDLGYNESNAQLLVNWTKIEEDFGTLLARFRNGWVSRQEVVNELVAKGLPAERAEEFVQARLDNLEAPFRVANERDLTKAEIVKGVDAGKLTFDEGVGLLVQLGYDDFEADFILDISVEAARGSPETPAEFERITRKFQRVKDRKAGQVTERVIKLEKDLLECKEKVRKLTEEGASRNEINNLNARCAGIKSALDAERRQQGLA